MNPCLYPKNLPRQQAPKVVAVVIPANKKNLWPGQSWNHILEHLKQILRLSRLKVLLLMLTTLLLSATSGYGQSACPGSNCTSGDMVLTKVELVDANTLGTLPNICQPGQTSIPVKLKVTIDVTADTRYGFLLIGNISINGQFQSKVWQCYPQDFTQGPHTLILDQVIQWPCGSTITLSDVYTAWRHQAPSTTICSYLNSNGTISDCAAIDPKCKYYEEQSFTVAAPLVANFNYGGTCGANDLYQPITFTSSTTGGNTPYQYSWEIRDAATNNLLASSTSNPYVYTPQSGNNLSVKLTITDASNPQQSDDETKTVTVTSCCAPPTVTSNPANQQKCQGAAASFSVGYSGGTPTPSIQWQISTNGGSTWTNLSNNATYSGVTLGTLNISTVTLAMNNNQYKAVLKSGACAAVESNAATLTVDPTSVGGSAASPQSICYGSQPLGNLTLSGQTGTVVKWQSSTSSDFTSGVTDIANTSTTLTAATIGSLTQDTWFRAVLASGVCSSANSNPVKITVDPLSVGGSVASNQTICYGSQPPSNLTLSGHTGSVVKWQKSTSSNFTTGVTDIANTTTTLTAAAIGALTQDTWFRAVVTSGVCSSANSNSIKITVDPLSVGGSLASPQTICSGNQLSANLALSGHTGSIVKWQKSTSANFSSGVSDIANTNATLTPAQAGALNEDTWFRVIVKSGVCSQTNSDPVKITVQQPIGNNTIAASQTICSGNTPNGLTGSVPTGGDGNFSYQWQVRTSGSWSNIPGASAKDYAPGSLSENTQFRRMVTAGSACSGAASATVTISISPESQVYAIAGSNYCESAPNTGSVKLMSSYPGVSYQLMKQTINGPVDVPPAKIGNGSALEWIGLEAGTYYVYGTGLAPTYCTSQTATANVLMFDCSVFYTLTQGYYGGKNGKSCIGTNPVNTIKYLLGITDLVTGTTNSVTVPATNEGAIKLNQSMPGGNTPNALPAGNCVITSGCFVNPTYLTQQGRINNILLSQTITLGLNVRWNNGELLLFPIRSGYLTTQKMKGCFPNAVLVETCESGTISSILMNQNVVNYLGPNGTVGDLLQLANDVLGGTKTPGVDGVPSYADVNEAVDCINKSFDEGRRFLDYFEEKQTCEMLFPAPALPDGSTTITTTAVSSYREPTSTISISAYPNPFTDDINFEIETKQSGQATLDVYNITGQKIKTVYNGYINAGIQRFRMNVPAQQTVVLFYVFQMGDQKLTGKLLQKSSR